MPGPVYTAGSALVAIVVGVQLYFSYIKKHPPRGEKPPKPRRLHWQEVNKFVYPKGRSAHWPED